jgi:hypothetical protein
MWQETAQTHLRDEFESRPEIGESGTQQAFRFPHRKALKFLGKERALCAGGPSCGWGWI